jgi:uncharacterized membrane protein
VDVRRDPEAASEAEPRVDGEHRGFLRRTVASASLGVVLLATLASLALSIGIRAPCAAGSSWADGRQYRWLCYTDIVPLLGTEQLQGGRLPFIDACSPPSGGQCDEYPVLTMYFMRAAAWMSQGSEGYFYATATLLALCTGATAWLLYRMAGSRALYFAAAPSLWVYGLVNWDLFAVALTVGALYLYLRGQDIGTGIALGLGAAAKLFPALLVIPFALGRLREHREEGAAHVVVWSGITYLLVNLPFVLAGPNSWITFFRFNAERGFDWDSLLFVTCTQSPSFDACNWPIRSINILSGAVFVALAVIAWFARELRDPDFPRWTFGFPLLILFLLTSKVYSPQYSLWLLPWFALVMPNPWVFGAFSLADVAVFVTRFSYFGVLEEQGGNPALQGFDGASLGMFQLALALRALALLACVVAWVLERRPGEELERQPAGAALAEAGA